MASKLTGFFLTVLFLSVLSGAEIDLFVPSFPKLQEIFDLTPSEVTLTLGINLVAHCVTSLIIGHLADCYGRKPVLLWGIIIFLIGTICCIFAQNYWTLLFGRFLQGLG